MIEAFARPIAVPGRRRLLAIGGTLALTAVLLAGGLSVLRWWSVDAGIGRELSASFELGPLGSDRVVAQSLRIDSADLIGFQLLARATGTLAPLTVLVELRVGASPAGRTTVRVFPARQLQPVRVLFPAPAGPGRADLRLRQQPGQPGGVLFGATRIDRYPDGVLSLDGVVSFADQDLAFRPLHRGTAWSAIARLAEMGPAGPVVAGLSAALLALGLSLVTIWLVRVHNHSRRRA